MIVDTCSISSRTGCLRCEERAKRSQGCLRFSVASDSDNAAAATDSHHHWRFRDFDIRRHAVNSPAYGTSPGTVRPWPPRANSNRTIPHIEHGHKLIRQLVWQTLTISHEQSPSFTTVHSSSSYRCNCNLYVCHLVTWQCCDSSHLSRTYYRQTPTRRLTIGVA